MKKHNKQNRKYWYNKWLAQSEHRHDNVIVRWLKGDDLIDFDRDVYRFTSLLFGFDQSKPVDYMDLLLRENPNEIQRRVTEELKRIATYMKVTQYPSSTLQGMSDCDKGRHLLVSAKKMGIVNGVSALNDFAQ
jgi:hypothetical protein